MHIKKTSHIHKHRIFLCFRISQRPSPPACVTQGLLCQQFSLTLCCKHPCFHTRSRKLRTRDLPAAQFSTAQTMQEDELLQPAAHSWISASSSQLGQSQQVKDAPHHSTALHTIGAARSNAAACSQTSQHGFAEEKR